MLSERHQALSVYDKELFAMLFAVRKWHQYLASKYFIIRIDHQPLKYLIEQKLSTPSQYIGLAKLMAYDYEIQYKQGKLNVVADALSRISSLEVSSCAITSVSTDLIQRIKMFWEEDMNLHAKNPVVAEKSGNKTLYLDS